MYAVYQMTTNGLRYQLVSRYHEEYSFLESGYIQDILNEYPRFLVTYNGVPITIAEIKELKEEEWG